MSQPNGIQNSVLQPMRKSIWLVILLGVITAASQINKKLLIKRNAETICSKSVKISFLAASIIIAFSFHSYFVFPFLISIFIFIGMLNLISPNSIAIALSPYGHQAGTTSALYGCLQWSMAFFSTLLVSCFHNGSALPMASAMFFVGLCLYSVIFY